MDAQMRRQARRLRESAGFWGRQTQGNVNLGLSEEMVRSSAKVAAHHYLEHQNLIEGRDLGHRDR